MVWVSGAAMWKLRKLLELARSGGGSGRTFTHVMWTADNAMVGVTRVLQRLSQGRPAALLQTPCAEVTGELLNTGKLPSCVQ